MLYATHGARGFMLPEENCAALVGATRRFSHGSGWGRFTASPACPPGTLHSWSEETRATVSPPRAMSQSQLPRASRAATIAGDGRPGVQIDQVTSGRHTALGPPYTCVPCRLTPCPVRQQICADPERQGVVLRAVWKSPHMAGRWHRLPRIPGWRRLWNWRVEMRSSITCAIGPRHSARCAVNREMRNVS